MKTLSRLVLVAVLAHLLAFAAPATGQDNTAVAVNTKDGKSVFKLAFSVKKATGDVDASNTAVAYASCTDCKTVAAAIQVVLVSGDVSSATPENVAIAINYDCTECDTMAAAFQFVYGDGQELAFTPEGKARLHDLRKSFHDLKQREDLSLADLAREIGVIAAQVQKVVETEVEVKKATEVQAATPSTTVAPSTTTTTVAGPASTTTTSTAPVTTTSVAPSTTTSPPTTVAATTTTAAP